MKEDILYTAIATAIVSLILTYWIIRKAVAHGLEDYYEKSNNNQLNEKSAIKETITEIDLSRENEQDVLDIIKSKKENS